MIHNCNDEDHTSRCIFDSNGVEYDQVIEYDTDTGRLVKAVLEEGAIVFNAETGERVLETVFVPAPLTIRMDPTHSCPNHPQRRNVHRHPIPSLTDPKDISRVR